jgi:hypothetical protein
VVDAGSAGANLVPLKNPPIRPFRRFGFYMLLRLVTIFFPRKAAVFPVGAPCSALQVVHPRISQRGPSQNRRSHHPRPDRRQSEGARIQFNADAIGSWRAAPPMQKYVPEGLVVDPRPC